MKIGVRRIIGFILCLTLIISNLHLVSMASDDRTLIKRVSITVTADVEAGSTEGTVDATVPNNVDYQIEEAVFSGKSTGFKPGDKPKVKIVIAANDGYYFNAISGSSTFSIKGATYTSAKRLDNNTKLEVIVTIKEVSGVFGEVPSATWVDGGSGKAKWEKAEYANAYELRLYRGNSQVKKIEKVTGTTYDFKEYMKDVGTYYYFVRAVAKDEKEDDYTEQNEWVQSDERYLTQEDAEKNAGSGNKTNDKNTIAADSNDPNKTGWIKEGDKWWYKNKDGSYPTNDWMRINDKWYLFDPFGYMLTGWRMKNDKYYYLNPNGDMGTGWLQDDRKWYYLRTNGEMHKGWLEDKGNWYCLDSQGVMLTGWVKSADNHDYFLNPSDGAMVRNATVDGFYIDNTGVWIP